MFGREAAVKHTLLSTESMKYLGCMYAERFHILHTHAIIEEQMKEPLM